MQSKRINKLLRRSAFDLILFGYVDAIVTEFSSVSIAEAVKMFARRNSLSAEEFNTESAMKTITRMRAELKDYDIATRSDI